MDKQNLTEIDYGPLSLLIGQWAGESGEDISPEPEGKEVNRYRESLTFEPIEALSNAEQQEFAVLQYRQKVHRIHDGKRIHDQTGYWGWNATSGQVMHSFVIPRGLAVVAVGQVITLDDGYRFELSVQDDTKDGGILQSEFLQQQALTKAFSQSLIITEKTLSYQQTSSLTIYGRDFEHSDENKLQAV